MSVAITMDAAELKKKDEIIDARQLQDILNNVPGIIFVKDLEGHYRIINQTFERIFGLKSEMVLGKTSYDLFPKEMADQFTKSDRKTLQCGKRLQVEEEIVVNNVRYTFLTSKIPMFDEKGKPYAICGIAIDITDRKKIEKELEQYRQGLEKLVDIRTRELKSLTQELFSIQERERRELAKELHDETGQYLTAIKMILARSAQAKDWKLIEQANDLVNQLVGGIRDLTFRLRPSVLDDLGLNHALSEYFDHYKKQTGINVAFNYTGKKTNVIPPDVATAVYRIIQEALNNVAKYAGVDEVQVGLEINDTLRLKVIDKGKGFNPQEIKFLSTHGIKGMQERVSILDGKFTIESGIGKGTTINIELPLNVG